MISSRSLGEPAVRHPQSELGRALARDDDQAGALEKWLEVDVPDPRDVLPVGDRVVERDDEDGRHTRFERSHHLVRPRRVLDQEEDDGLPARRIRSKRPKAALNRSRPARTSSSDAPTVSASAVAVTAL